MVCSVSDSLWFSSFSLWHLVSVPSSCFKIRLINTSSAFNIQCVNSYLCHEFDACNKETLQLLLLTSSCVMLHKRTLCLQDPFSTPFYAIMFTWVMLLGELDFNDIFYPEDAPEEIQYSGATYTWFLIFLVLMAIIIMNLLVGFWYSLNHFKRVIRHSKILHFASISIRLACDYKMASNLSLKRAVNY